MNTRAPILVSGEPQARCAACHSTFRLPAVAICPTCASRQVRRLPPAEFQVLKAAFDEGRLDGIADVKRAVISLLRNES